MKLSAKVQIMSVSDGHIEFSIEPGETVFRLCQEDLAADGILVLGNAPQDDQVLIKKEFLDRSVIIYIKNQEVLAASYKLDQDFTPDKNSFAFDYVSYFDEIALKQTSETSVTVFTSAGNPLFTLDDIAAYDPPEGSYPVDLQLTTVESRYLLAGKITYGQFNTYLVYDLFRKEMITRSMRFNLLANHAELELKLSGPDLLEVSFGADHAAVNFLKITGKGKQIFEFYQLEEQRDKHLLAQFLINDKRYFIHNKQNGIFMTRGNAIGVSGYKTRLKAFFTGQNLYIYGRSTHYAYRASGEYDYLYLDGNEEPITKFKRPFKSRFFRRFGFFKVPIVAIAAEGDRRAGLYLGDEEFALHTLKTTRNSKREKIVSLKRKEGRIYLLTASKRGNMAVQTSEHPEEYTLKKRMQKRLGKLQNNKNVLRLFKYLFIVIGRLPKKQKLVVFESFHAKQYSDNPRAIYEYMKEHYTDYRLLWSIDRKEEDLFKQFDVPYVRRFTIRWFLNFPRAKYWVNNVRLPSWMPKPRDTVYIQTWHGTPLKRLGIDIEEIHMPGTNTSTYKRNFVMEAKKWDYLVSPNPYSTEIFRRAFHYPGEVIESGYPRNDVLANKKDVQVSDLKTKLRIPKDKKVMLYTPTWRDNEFYEKGKYKFEFQFNLDRWKEEFGDEWILLSRMHYLVAENFDFSSHEGTVYDASSYPDIRDLYLISDLMITDYSSVFFDFAILDRPILFFMYDLAQYRDQLRGFYIDIEEEAPGPIAETEEEFFKALHELKDSNVQGDPKFSKFKEKFSTWEDGRATERVVKAFLEQNR